MSSKNNQKPAQKPTMPAANAPKAAPTTPTANNGNKAPGAQRPGQNTPAGRK